MFFSSFQNCPPRKVSTGQLKQNMYFSLDAFNGTLLRVNIQRHATRPIICSTNIVETQIVYYNSDWSSKTLKL